MKQRNMAFMSEMEQIFLKRSGKAYHNLKSRLSEKRDKNERIIRRGRELPFSLDELRVHMRGFFDANWQARCPYDNRIITPRTMELEHIVPLNRGGDLNLSNLCLSDDDCNRVKGSLLPNELKALLDGLQTFPEPARRDILGRLRGRTLFFKPQKKTMEVNVGNTAS